MYLDLSTLIGIGIALVLSTLTIIYSMAENYSLQQTNRWLQKRNRELSQRIGNMVDLPW